MSIKIKYKKNEPILLQIYVAFVFCFGYLFNMYILAGIGVVASIVFSLITEKKVSINISYAPLLICLCFWLVSAIYSNNSIYAIKFLMYFISIVFIFMMRDDLISTTLFSALLCFSAIQVAFVILQFLNYDFVDAINKVLLSDSQYAIASSLYNWSGALTGITAQTASAALYCVTLISIVSYKACKVRLLYFLDIFPIMALFLTQKRSFLFLGIFLILLMELFNRDESINDKLGLIVIVGATVLVVYFLIVNYFDITMFVKKIKSGSFSGRFELWNSMIYIFKENPLFGTGLYSTDKLLGMTGHNIYLQLLCENGIIGAIPFYLVLVYLFVIAIKYDGEFEKTYFARYHLFFILAYGLLGNPIYEHTHIILFVITYDVLINNKKHVLWKESTI